MKLLYAALALGILVFAAADPKNVLTGDSAFASYSNVKAGTWRHIPAASLPKPFATPSASNGAQLVPRPEGAMPVAPAGFKVELFTTGLMNPRLMRAAPNGDIFLAETNGNGQIKVFRGKEMSVYATGLNQPFGIAFYPPGPNPRFLYIGNTNAVVRFPYKVGDLKATGAAETIVPNIPTGGHSTRDVAFSQDGR